MRKNDGRLIAVMALAAVLSFLFINMTQKGTHKELVIHYNKDGAWVESSPCPDKICIKEGRIQKPGETIACVPEKVLLTLQSAAKEREHDAILR